MTDTRAIFEDARTHTAWQERPVPDEMLRRVYDVAKMGPSSANCCPMRAVFVKSAEAKARLKPCLNEGNVEKTMKAPATAIVAYDTGKGGTKRPRSPRPRRHPPGIGETSGDCVCGI